MKYYAVFVILSFCTATGFTQKARITEREAEIKTYSFSDPDPVAGFTKFYPYYRFDGYESRGIMRKWKMIEMENDYIKVWIMPEIGGKIWGAIEKSTGREFIYYNHVVKFRNVAMRGPWTSGGIEINFGVIGHAPTTSSPVDYYLRNNEDGSVSCFLGAPDLTSGTRWTVEVNLPKDKAYFTTRTVWDNPTDIQQSYYHWMNMGIKTRGNLEYVFPGDKYIGHSGDSHSWPVKEDGREISFYENNDFGGPKSYHVLGEATGFYGIYWHDDDFGFAHYSGYDEKPGKKIWIWGLSDEGMIWERLLTDNDGQYSEIQSGRMFNQADPRSSNTPFRNRGFAAGSTDQWTEYWFPVKGTRGLRFASPSGSVNLEKKENAVTLWFCPNENITGTLEVRNGSQVIYSKVVDAKPLQVLTGSFEYIGNYKNMSVWLNGNLVYDADREKFLTKRPAQAPRDIDTGTSYRHFLNGAEFERQRLYDQAEKEYILSLEIDKWFVPALNGLSRISYRKGNYSESMASSLKALSVDTYDPDANMMYGLAGLALGDTVSAVDGFSIASLDVSGRRAAYNKLASVCIGKGEYAKGLDYAENSLLFNSIGSDAIQLKILCLRKLGRMKEAENEITELEKRDPLNHLIRFERFITDPSGKNSELLLKYISNELPHETFLEYAIWYYRNRQIADALKVLGVAPGDHPIVMLWEAYLNHLNGNNGAASDALNRMLKTDPMLVFPFRSETLIPLEWAQKLSDNWKLKYFSGLVYLGAGNEPKGRDLWESCGKQPDFYPFYFARAELYEPGSIKATTDINRALELAGDEWRAGWIAAKYFQKSGDNKKAEEIAGKYYKIFPGNFNLGIVYAQVLEANEKYSSCLGVLDKIEMLPSEGSGISRAIWRNANLGYAKQLMASKKYRKALEFIDQARKWPVSLGVGKPYNPDETREDALALECYTKLNDSKGIKKITDKKTE